MSIYHISSMRAQLKRFFNVTSDNLKKRKPETFTFLRTSCYIFSKEESKLLYHQFYHNSVLQFLTKS